VYELTQDAGVLTLVVHTEKEESSAGMALDVRSNARKLSLALASGRRLELALPCAVDEAAVR